MKFIASGLINTQNLNNAGAKTKNLKNNKCEDNKRYDRGTKTSIG